MDNHDLYKTILELDGDEKINLGSAIEYEPESGRTAGDGKTIIDQSGVDDFVSYGGGSGFTFEVEGIEEEVAETPLSNHLQPDMTLKDGRYRIIKTIGAGGFGVVYRAYDSKLNIEVAIKELYPSSLVNRVPGEKKMIIYGKDNARQYAYLLDRFILEARSMAKFNSVKNIVNIFDCFQENNTAYIVMEHIKGCTLDQYVTQNGGRLSVERATELMSCILDGLSAIHIKGIIHRDIKPKNIFITNTGELKIIDFGAARFSSTEEQVVTRYSKVLTPGFAPPEQYRRDSKQGPYTDIYAASAVYYYMVTGVVPKISVDRVVKDDIKPLGEVVRDVPDYVQRAISRSLELNSDLRLQTAAELKSGLNGHKIIRYVAEEKKMRFRRRILIIAATAAALCIAAVGVVAYKLTHAQDITIDKLLAEDAAISLCVPLSADGGTSNAQITAWETVAAEYSAYVAENSEREASLALTYASASTYAESTQTNPATLMLSSGDEDAPAMEYISRLVSGESTLLYDMYSEENDAANSYIFAFDPTVLYINEKLLDSVQAGATEFTSVEQMLGIKPEDGVELLAVNEADADYYKSLADIGGEGSYFTAIDRFCMGNVLFYIGHVSDNLAIGSAMPGLYSVAPAPDVDGVRAIGYEWQINSDCSENEANAAQLLLSFITGEDMQDVLFVQSGQMIPVNPAAYAKFMEYNPQFAFIDKQMTRLMIADEEISVSTSEEQ